MRFKLRMVVEATFEVDPKNYGDPILTDPQEMLAIDIDAIRNDPEAWMGNAIDEAEQETPGYVFEVTGEVVED